MERFAKVVGRVLRHAREARGLTLKEVERRSRGRFKPSSLGGYERGERTISLERFSQLATLYEVPADQLLLEAQRAQIPGHWEKTVIDLTRLPRVQGEPGRRVAEFVHDVQRRRGDYHSDVISLRSGDLENVALSAGLRPRDLLQKLGPAVGEPDEPA